MMSLKKDAFPSSIAFEHIAASLASSEDERKAAIKRGNAVFTLTLKNAQGETASWYIDLKDTGEVGQGSGPSGKDADVILSLADEDFGKLVDGKANAQRLFMSGKLKIKGDMTKATRVEPVLKKARVTANL